VSRARATGAVACPSGHRVPVNARSLHRPEPLRRQAASRRKEGLLLRQREFGAADGTASVGLPKICTEPGAVATHVRCSLTLGVAEHSFSPRVNQPHPQDQGDRVREGSRRRHLHGVLDVHDVSRVPREAAAASSGVCRGARSREEAGPEGAAARAVHVSRGMWCRRELYVRPMPHPLPGEGARRQGGARSLLGHLAVRAEGQASEEPLDLDPPVDAGTRPDEESRQRVHGERQSIPAGIGSC
jgi:hypothetical protein